MGRREPRGVGSVRQKTTVRNGKKYVYWEARATEPKQIIGGKQIQKSFSGKTKEEALTKMQKWAENRRGHTGPDTRGVVFTNFKEKALNNIGLSDSESRALGKLCSLGALQVFKCYQHYPEALSQCDVAFMCRNCCHSTAPKPDEPSVDIFNPSYISYFFDLSDNQPRNAHVYFVSDGYAVKIGRAKDPAKRLIDLQVGNPRRLKILFTIPFGDEETAAAAELKFHSIFKDYRLEGEWFDILSEINVTVWRNYWGQHNKEREA